MVSPECVPLCEKRCSLHSRKRLCVRTCSTCCARCKCVPPGTYGNKEVCGRCYTDMTTHGGKPKCPQIKPMYHCATRNCCHIMCSKLEESNNLLFKCMIFQIYLFVAITCNYSNMGLPYREGVKHDFVCRLFCQRFACDEYIALLFM